ncbi:MAG: efflux RND transporter periplasmic adaptor subunit [Candidatus Poribacteria bacterium]|nr:efflux RND transporter periplasmic adaptor subunit [Candidatus Poribacteria bacterium]
MNKWKIITIVGVVVLVVGAAVIIGRMVFATKGDSGNSDAPAVQTATVQRGDIAVTIDATGTIKPLNIVEISSKASGKILKLNVDAGDYVEKDDVIAIIEDTYVQISLEQAEADLKAAEARLQQSEIDIQLQKEQSEIQIRQSRESLAESKKRLEQIKEQIRLEKIANKRGVKDSENSLKIANLRYKLLTSETVREENKKRAEATVTQDKVNLDLAKTEHERNVKLFEEELISQASLDTSQAQYRSAEARYKSAQEQLKLVEKPASEVELELARADIKKAEFALEVAKERIEAEASRDMDIELQQQRISQAEDALKLAETNKKQIDRKERDLQSAKASLKRSQGQRDLRQIEFEDTIIKAPISGTILEKKVEEGQVITSRLSSIASSEGQTLVAMADLNTVFVVTEVDETDIGKVNIGQPVTITVEAYPDMPFEGQVLKIAPLGQVIQNITTFEVTSELKNVGAIGATGSRQGMRRGAGGWQGGQMGDLTDEQRERFRAMRQQRQAEGGDENQNQTRRPDRQEPATQQPTEPAVAQTEEESEDDWGTLFGGLLEETPPENTPDITQQPEPESAKMPFLKPGMNASVQISAVNKIGILTLPSEAILDMRGRKMVRPIGEDGQPSRPQPIVVGVSSYDKVEIISGLAEGDIVAIGVFQRGNNASEMFRRMMQNPASTVRRMGGGGGPPRGR